MRDCIFCREFTRGQFEINVPVASTDHFAVFADLAPVAFGHILILPKRHYCSLAEMDAGLLDELSGLVRQFVTVAERAFDFVAIAEHGSGGASSRRLSCIEHAHIHICPLKQAPEQGGRIVEVATRSGHTQLGTLSELSDFVGTEYLLWGGGNGALSLWTPQHSGCSQLLRRVMNTLNGKEHCSWEHAIRKEMAQQTAKLYGYLLNRERASDCQLLRSDVRVFEDVP